MSAWIENITSNPKHAAALLGGTIRCKSDTMEATRIDREKRLVWSCIAAPTVDMDCELVVPDGIERDYFPDTIKTVYIDHDYKRYPLGVGVCRNLSFEPVTRRLLAQSYITTRAIGDELLVAIEEGAVGGCSVGVLDIDVGSPTDAELKLYGSHDEIVRRSKLIEYSFTATPCNMDALVELTRRGKIRRESAVAFGLPDSPERKYFDTGYSRIVNIDENPKPIRVIDYPD